MQNKKIELKQELFFELMPSLTEIKMLEMTNKLNSSRQVVYRYVGNVGRLDRDILIMKLIKYAKDKQYYLKFGFNTDIIEGLHIDSDYNIVDMFAVEVYQVVFSGTIASMKQIANFGDDDYIICLIKSCQWIYEKEKK